VLIEAVMTGDRPVHLERCDLCADRAKDASRWLDEVHTVATAAADSIFTPERLAVQQTAVMRRLEQLDEPRRVIAFPGQGRAAREASSGRRVAPAWVGVAAAAGLAFGVVGGQWTARRSTVSPTATASGTTPLAAPVTPAPAPATAIPVTVDAVSLGGSADLEYEHMGLPTMLTPVDEITPKIVVSARARRY
jgi:hypothetical protein